MKKLLQLFAGFLVGVLIGSTIMEVSSSITKPYTFSAGTVIYSSYMNDNFDILYNEANRIIALDIEGTQTQVATNVLDIAQHDTDITAIEADYWVEEDRIDTDAITTYKIADYAVEEDKVDTDAITENKIADSAVTEDKIADGAVTVSKLETYTAGDNLMISADTEQSKTGTSYTKVKEIRISRGGTLRIKFDLKSSVSGAVYGRIYRNGVAVGTEQTTSSQTYVTESEDIDGWSSGDLCQLYYMVHIAGGYSVFVKNFRLYSGITTQEVVITD